MSQRYSGFKHARSTDEDFEMWYHVCADAEPGWENTPEGRASARAREEEERQNAKTEEDTAEEGARAIEQQRTLDIEMKKKDEKEKAEKAKQEELRQRRILQQEVAARQVAERLAAQVKAAEEERRKKTAKIAERIRVREEKERRRAKEAAEAVSRQRLAEEEQRRKRREAEESAALRKREEDADKKRAQADDQQWARLQHVIQAEYDDLTREYMRLQDAQDAASARRWLEKRRRARLHPNNNESIEHEPQEHHAGHDAERERLVKVSIELADLELIVKAITNFRTNPPSPSSSITHSFLSSLSTVPSSPISVRTDTNQHNPYQLNTHVSEVRVLTARDDRPDNQSDQAMRDRNDFLVSREEQRRVAAMTDMLLYQDRFPPAGWLGICAVM